MLCCFGTSGLCLMPWGDARGAEVPAWEQAVAGCWCCSCYSSQNERLQTSEKKPVSCVSKAIAHPAPKLSTFWVSGTAKAELALPWWAFLKGLGLSPGKRQPCIHRGRAGALEIRILIKLLSFYFKNQNSSNGFHFPPTENRILRKICNLSLKNLSANYSHFHTGDHFHDNSTQSTK